MYLSAWGTKGRQLLESKIEAYVKDGLSREEAILRVAEDERIVSGKPRKFSCPECDTLVSSDDKFCRNCGTSLAKFIETLPEVPEQPQKRGAPLTRRFYKLIMAPSEAMKDIALAPDYGGIAVIFVLRIVEYSVLAVLVLQKIQFSGPYAETINEMLVGIPLLVGFLVMILYVARWLIKSVMVRAACEGKSSWNFKTAASITGYAYIADIVIDIFRIPISLLLLPTLDIDTSNLAAATQTLNNYRAQIGGPSLVYVLALSLLGLLWKSYLGGLGAYFGTEKKCSVGKGIAVFFALGLIGLFVTFVAGLA